MIISIIYLVISLVLEVIMSNFFTSILNDVSLFSTIYTIIGLSILYPHFNNDKKYYILVGICGIIFDIVYTSTFMFNFILFVIIGIIIKILYNIFPENIFMTNLISFIVIVVYHLLCFIILSLFSGISYNFSALINIILGSIIMTIIYSTISYYIIRYIFNRKGIKFIK